MLPSRKNVDCSTLSRRTAARRLRAIYHLRPRGRRSIGLVVQPELAQQPRHGERRGSLDGHGWVSARAVQPWHRDALRVELLPRLSCPVKRGERQVKQLELLGTQLEPRDDAAPELAGG